MNNLNYRQHNASVQNIPTDVILQVGGREFPAHRTVLKDSSPVLKIQLSEFWTREKSRRIGDNNPDNVYVLHEGIIDLDVINELLQYLYSQWTRITEQNAHSLCIAADFLDIPTLSEAAQTCLSRNLDIDNVLSLFLFANNLSLKTLTDHCVAFIVHNYRLVLQGPELLNFNEDELKALIDELKLQKDSFKIKEAFFEGLVRWTTSDLPARQPSLPAILDRIPLSECSKEFLMRNEASPTMTFCQEALRDAINESTNKSYYIYCFGGLTKHSSLPYISRLNYSTGEWSSVTLPPSQQPSDGDDFVVCGSKVYILNGYRSRPSPYQPIIDIEPPLRRTSRYARFGGFISAGGAALRRLGHGMNRLSIETGDKSTAPTSSSVSHSGPLEVMDSANWPHLNLPRSNFQCAAIGLGDYIYVCGGDGRPNQSTARYNTLNNQWDLNLAPMQKDRLKHRLVELNGCIYALGGEARTFSETVERYDPLTNQWTTMANMNFRHDANRTTFSAAAHKGKIYVLSMRGFEVYTPEEDRWRWLNNPVFSNGTSLVAIDGGLLALGGGPRTQLQRTETSAFKTVYEFDSFNQVWNRLQDMSFARQNHCSVVVNCPSTP